MTRFYVSGPMRGIPKFNFDAFDSLSEQLEADGHEAVNPAAHDRDVYPDIETWPGFATGDIDECPNFDLRSALAWDLVQVAECDELILLPGWENSSGAKHERYVAEACGKAVWLAHTGRYVWHLEWDDVQRRMTALLDAPADTERIVVNPDTGGAKGQKLARFDLIPPGPLRALAEHYGRGAAKYADRNWELGYAWSLSYGAAMRHLWAWWGGENDDPEMRSSHLDAAAFHIFALRHFLETHPELDDRPATLAAAVAEQELIDELVEAMKKNTGPPMMLSSRELTRVDL